MPCGLAVKSSLAALAVLLLTAAVPAAPATPGLPDVPALHRFLAIKFGVVRQASTLRHLEARTEHFGSEAWMDVRTDADAAGFRYTVTGEGGSGMVRSRALRATLEQEKRAWTDGQATSSWFTTGNYDFTDMGQADGLVRIGIKPKRRDLMLVEGQIFLAPDTGALIRVEGNLTRSPSFWTKKVNMVRHYTAVSGIQMPIAVESTAQVRLAGSSTFRMTYRYESLNGQRVDTP